MAADVVTLPLAILVINVTKQEVVAFASSHVVVAVPQVIPLVLPEVPVVPINPVPLELNVTILKVVVLYA